VYVCTSSGVPARVDGKGMSPLASGAVGAASAGAGLPVASWAMTGPAMAATEATTTATLVATRARRETSLLGVTVRH